MKEFFAGGYHAVSLLPKEFQPALQELFFFNKEQFRLRESMLSSIERFGRPAISIVGDRVIVSVGGKETVQSLYIIKGSGVTSKLCGVVVYVREENDLHVVFVGLDPEHTYLCGSGNYLFVEIFALLKTVGRRIRGVKHIQFFQGTRLIRLKVRP